MNIPSRRYHSSARSCSDSYAIVCTLSVSLIYSSGRTLFYRGISLSLNQLRIRTENLAIGNKGIGPPFARHEPFVQTKASPSLGIDLPDTCTSSDSQWRDDQSPRKLSCSAPSNSETCDLLWVMYMGNAGITPMCLFCGVNESANTCAGLW